MPAGLAACLQDWQHACRIGSMPAGLVVVGIFVNIEGTFLEIFREYPGDNLRIYRGSLGNNLGIFCEYSANIMGIFSNILDIDCVEFL